MLSQMGGGLLLLLLHMNVPFGKKAHQFSIELTFFNTQMALYMCLFLEFH